MSTFSVPYTFVNGTVADGTQVNANFSAIVAAGNNINATNIGALGLYASNIIPTTITQGTFGGTQPYTFNNALIATPTSSAPTPTTGTVWYDQTQDSLSYFNSTGFETNIGQEVDQVVYNGTGSTLNPGQAVYISGAGSGAYTAYAAVSLAIATATSTANAIGVVGQTIANGSVGMVVILGRITNVNTTSWTTGQTLYLDYSTAGNLITTQPSSPYYAVRIGFVIVGGSSSGSIFVSVRNVYTLGSNIISPVVFTAFSNTSTPLTLNGVSSQIAPLFNVNTLASGGTNVFQIAASGAASFSNTVTANSGFVSSTGLTSGSSTYGPTSASVAGSITPGYSSTVGTSSIYSGTGTPAFSAPSGSLYLSYSGSGGGLVYYNSSSAGTSGSTWSTLGITTNSLTINSGGSGGSSPQTFNGSSAVTISYNTIGASPLAGSTSLTTVGTITTGTWNAGSVTTSGSFVANLSTYGPTSATVNGNITANGALIFGGSGGGAWSVFSNQVALTPGSSQTSGGYIANAANTSEIISWDNSGNLTSLGSFKTGSSTYGSTSATVAGLITGNVSGGTNVSLNSTTIGATLYMYSDTASTFTIETFQTGNSSNKYTLWLNKYGGTVATGGSFTVNGGVTAYSLTAPSSNLILNSGGSSASVIATNYNNGATGGFAVGNGGTGYYGTITSSGITTAGALITSLNAGSSSFPAGNNSYAGMAWNGSGAYAEATIFTSYSSPGRTASFWYWNGSSYSQSSYIQTNGTYTSISDKTLKENIQPLAMGLKEVMLLKPSSFTWKHNGKADHGFIAQDVQEVIPAAVEPMYSKDGEPDTNGILGMSYTHIIPVLVNAIQELKAELDSLKAAKNATT